MCTVNKHLLVFLYNSKLKILFKDCPLQCFIDVEIVINILIFQSSKKTLFSHGSYIYFKKIATIMKMIHFNSRSEKKYYTTNTKYLFKMSRSLTPKVQESIQGKKRKKIVFISEFSVAKLEMNRECKKKYWSAKTNHHHPDTIRILSGSPDMNNSEIEDWDTMIDLLTRSKRYSKLNDTWADCVNIFIIWKKFKIVRWPIPDCFIKKAQKILERKILYLLLDTFTYIN